MIDHLFLIVFCIIAYEILVRSSILSIAKDNMAVLKKVGKVIPSKRISDHWKEKMVPVYAFRLMKNSFLMLLILCVVMALASLFYLISHSFFDLAISVIGIIESVIIIYLYNQGRKLYE